MASPDLAAATQFLAGHARVLDRRRYERLFEDGPAGPLRDAVAAYRNSDGGFGYALEPDGRTPGSQPAAIGLALRTLHEADAWDDEMVREACDWLQRNAPTDGGVAFVMPSVEGWPRAPWWQPQDGLPPSLITTGLIAGMLYARRVEHPWLDTATRWMWSALDSDDVGPYDIRGVLDFLEHVPDRTRAKQSLRRIGERLRDPAIVAVDPDAPGEVHGPLDYARRPDSIARRFFSNELIDAHLDQLAAAQSEDGGWTFNWQAWSPVAEFEWRGHVTVEALITLRANGRI